MKEEDKVQQRLPETMSWIPAEVSRRHAVVGGAALAGYALAAQPVAASAILTAATGGDAGMVRFAASNGFTMDAYRARPAGGKHAPVVLVVQEIFGLHEWVKDICRRLANAGYYAIAPDLYAREGDATKIADISALVRGIVRKVPDAQVMADLDAAAVFAARDCGDAARLGVTGFCWGGRITWLYAAHNPKLKAGVAWYGVLAGEPTALQPTRAIDLAGRLHAPVLGLYGAKDQGIPVADVEKMQGALRAAKSASELILFPSAGHGFLADYRPSYDAKAATKAWADALGWFHRFL